MDVRAFVFVDRISHPAQKSATSFSKRTTAQILVLQSVR